MAAGDDWGQASVNNTNGFGKGAENNTIGWGSIHANSYGHPRTNLTGGGGFTGLFDQYGYPAFGASTRLLGANYSGGLVRVRAFDGSSDQGTADVMPYQIGSEYWVDLNSTLENLDATATGRGLTTSDTLGDLVAAGGANYDGFITTWYDQSGNANDATQGAAASQPQIVSGGALILENGNVALQFDGSNDFIQSINNIGILGNSSRSLYVVEKSNNNLNKTILSYGGTGVGEFYNFTQEFGIRVASGANLFELSKTNQTLLELTFPDGSSVLDDFELYIDSQAATQTSITVPTRLINTQDSQLTIGNYAGLYSSMNLQEIILYPSDQSAQRTGIQTNINSAFTIY